MKIYGSDAGHITANVIPAWQIEIVTTDCGPVQFFDNGIEIPRRSGNYVNCQPGEYRRISVDWFPTTRGNHHIVAEQRDADGTVISTRSGDHYVGEIPCLPNFTLACNLGSADGTGAWTGSGRGGGSFQ
ncbi:hypothetical protein ACWIGI_28120 [Nocardia sp. NPDC055321]